jgi:hypothetical protein
MRVSFVVLVTASALLVLRDGGLASATSVGHLEIGETSQRFLRSYSMLDLDEKDSASGEERAIDTSKLDDLLSADKIKATLNNVDKQDALFAKWFQDKAMSDAILKKLQSNFLANKDIILSYNNYRTRLTYNQLLDGWLNTKTLDDIFNTLDNSAKSKTAKMKEMFGAWHASGKTPEQVSKALAEVTNVNKAKRYAVLDFYYKEFVKLQKANAEKAAKQAAEEAKRAAAVS